MWAIKDTFCNESPVTIKDRKAICDLSVLYCYCLLPRLWQLVHGSQATSTDIYFAPNTIDFDTTALYIQHKATSRALLRKINIIAIHRLAFAYLTTTRHISLPLYFV